MQHTPATLGVLVRDTRKSLGLTQQDLAMTSGTGVRFVVELEQGKPTCQWGKVLRVVQTLGIRVDFTPPIVPGAEYAKKP